MNLELYCASPSRNQTSESNRIGVTSPGTRAGVTVTGGHGGAVATRHKSS